MANVSEIGVMKVVKDVTLGTGMVTAPVWVQWLQNASELVAFVAVLGGAVLVWLRVKLTLKEIRAKEK